MDISARLKSIIHELHAEKEQSSAEDPHQSAKECDEDDLWPPILHHHSLRCRRSKKLAVAGRISLKKLRLPCLVSNCVRAASRAPSCVRRISSPIPGQSISAHWS